MTHPVVCLMGNNGKIEVFSVVGAGIGRWTVFVTTTVCEVSLFAGSKGFLSVSVSQISRTFDYER